MKYNYQDIIKLQSAAEVNFEIADKALKKARGDFNKAQYLAMKKKKKSKSRSESTKQVSEVFNKFFSYRFVAYKKNTTYINIRMWILILFVFFIDVLFNSLEILILPLLVTLFLGVEYKIVCVSKEIEEPPVNIEPVVKNTVKDEDSNLNLSEELIEDDEEGYLKVEIDK